jgi:hypothetical protein
MRRTSTAGAVIALLCSAGPADAQTRWFSTAFGVAVPLAETRDFTPDASPASFTLETRQLVDPRLSVGIAWSFTELSDEVDEILDFRQLGFPGSGNVAGNLSGNQFRTINAMPLLLTAFYHPIPQPTAVVPYIGGGAGVTFSERRLNIGLAEFDDDAWAFTIAPQAGVLWWTSEWVAFGLDGRLSYGFGDDFDIAYWSINLGVAWRL